MRVALPEIGEPVPECRYDAKKLAGTIRAACHDSMVADRARITGLHSVGMPRPTRRTNVLTPDAQLPGRMAELHGLLQSRALRVCSRRYTPRRFLTRAPRALAKSRPGKSCRCRPVGRQRDALNARRGCCGM